MKNVLLLKVLAVSILFCITANSCRRYDDNLVDENSPAFRIAKSENLVVPDAVKLPINSPEGNSRVFTFFADGVQKYKAEEIPDSNPVAYRWVFVAPQADLYDATNNKVGTHSQGPTWQLSALDSIYGQAFDPPRTAPGSDAGSIDWLLLMPNIDRAPIGVFADVDYVQRLDTKGGKAPATPPTSATESISVPYTAIYRFSKRNP